MCDHDGRCISITMTPRTSAPSSWRPLFREPEPKVAGWRIWSKVLILINHWPTAGFWQAATALSATAVHWCTPACSAPAYAYPPLHALPPPPYLVFCSFISSIVVPWFFSRRLFSGDSVHTNIFTKTLSSFSAPLIDSAGAKKSSGDI